MRNQWQKPAPATSDSQFRLKVSQDFSFSVKIRDANHALLALRILLFKFYVREEKWNEEDQVLVTELRLYIEKLENFKGLLVTPKWLASKQLLKLSLTFPSLSDYPKWALAQVGLLRKHLMSPRAFLGLKTKVRDFFKSSNRTLWKKPRPQRYIGVGYRDKGTARVDHIDGSPSWQDVAAQNVNNPKIIFELPRTSIGIISPYLLRPDK